MTTDQFAQKQKARLAKIEEGKSFAEAVANSHARQVPRIFDKGIKSDGSKIGQYNSSKDLYVNPKFAPKGFSTKGKTGKTTFKNGKKHKTGFFTSYKAFRASQGRETSFVNLRLFGRLQLDYTNGLRRVSPLKWVAEVKTDINADKIQGNKERFGLTFSLTEKEREEFFKDQAEILRRELTK